MIPFYDYGKSGYSVPGTGSNDGLIGSASALYGSTLVGGDKRCSTTSSRTGCGIVYRLVPGKGQSYKLETLHVFKGAPSDGAAAHGTLLEDKNGDLYGTTFYGGMYNGGTLFELEPTSSGYKETILHSFGGGYDGAFPVSAPIEVKGVLYGTTLGGGTYLDKPICGTRKGGSPDGKCGTLYSVNPTTGAEQVLHSFGASGDGASPWASPLAVGGTLYGTTYLGGSVVACGTVFGIGLDGSNERVIHNFLNNPQDDGCDPLSSLISVKGLLYGTTCCGGGYFCSYCEGTLFSVDPSNGNEEVLHEFGYETDGSEPVAAVVDVGGVLYGTTAIGGGTECFTGKGCGTIFSYQPSATNPVYIVVYPFKGKHDGYQPISALLYSHHTLYGVTGGGGKKGYGTGYRLPP